MIGYVRYMQSDGWMKIWPVLKFHPSVGGGEGFRRDQQDSWILVGTAGEMSIYTRQLKRIETDERWT